MYWDPLFYDPYVGGYDPYYEAMLEEALLDELEKQAALEELLNAPSFVPSQIPVAPVQIPSPVSFIPVPFPVPMMKSAKKSKVDKVAADSVKSLQQALNKRPHLKRLLQVLVR